jgi:hypothetical protein
MIVGTDEFAARHGGIQGVALPAGATLAEGKS